MAGRRGYRGVRARGCRRGAPAPYADGAPPAIPQAYPWTPDGPDVTPRLPGTPAPLLSGEGIYRLLPLTASRQRWAHS
jgi:hypothetical protein